jgi:hypothetical protein
MSDPASYTVGWICALPVEYIAVQEFLDEEHEKPKHNVGIAVLLEDDIPDTVRGELKGQLHRHTCCN